jgi:uncharacterized protein YndB with AHSA1/START domain
MDHIQDIGARAVADLREGWILAAVELQATSERVFQALTSRDITHWWVRPGVFDTREWAGDIRVGGRWRASGMTRGQPYVQGGEFLEIDAPRKLVHTWDAGPSGSSTVTYILERLDGRTRLTLHHDGFVSRETCNAFAIGWETSLERLAEIFAEELEPRECSRCGMRE